MAFHVRDEATDAIVRKLAELKNKTLTEAIREAAEHEYEREWKKLPLSERVKPIQERFRALGRPTGLKADKAFYDKLSGEDELTDSL